MKYLICVLLLLVFVGGGCERDEMREQKRVCEELGLGVKYFPAGSSKNFMEEHIECVNK